MYFGLCTPLIRILAKEDLSMVILQREEEEYSKNNTNMVVECRKSIKKSKAAQLRPNLRAKKPVQTFGNTKVI